MGGLSLACGELRFSAWGAAFAQGLAKSENISLPIWVSGAG